MPIDSAAIRRCLDHLVSALTELRDALLHAEQAAAKTERLAQQAEAAAARDLAAAGELRAGVGAVAFRYTGAHWRPEAIRRRKLRDWPLAEALAMCSTEAEVRELAELRRYRPGWVWHVLRARRTGAAVADGIPPWVVE